MIPHNIYIPRKKACFKTKNLLEVHMTSSALTESVGVPNLHLQNSKAGAASEVHFRRFSLILLQCLSIHLSYPGGASGWEMRIREIKEHWGMLRGPPGGWIKVLLRRRKMEVKVVLPSFQINLITEFLTQRKSGIKIDLFITDIFSNIVLKYSSTIRRYEIVSSSQLNFRFMVVKAFIFNGIKVHLKWYQMIHTKHTPI